MLVLVVAFPEVVHRVVVMLVLVVSVMLLAVVSEVVVSYSGGIITELQLLA